MSNLFTKKKLISKFFEEIAQDSNKYCFGVRDTLYALDMGAVETLIVWENLEINRYIFRNTTTGTDTVKHLTKEDERDPSHFTENGVELEVVEKISLLEWFANNYKRFGANLEFITNRSQEGTQFCKGFGGIGGLLRYQVDFTTLDNDHVEVEEDLVAFF